MANEKAAYDAAAITRRAKDLFREERALRRMDGWFYVKEIMREGEREYAALPLELRTAHTLRRVLRDIPLSISENAVFAGTQRDAFARTYALINPAFKVEEFSGYCDPTGVFGDIEPNGEITPERIASLRDYNKNSAYVRTLDAAYREAEEYTAEVAFFVEQVTGHVIPDFRFALANGVDALTARLDERLEREADPEKRVNFEAMKVALDGVKLLAARYAGLAEEQMAAASPARRAELARMAAALRKVPAGGADTLYEAIQSFLLLWQVMCVEQTPNPFALSVGNADRIFEPYRAKEGLDRETAAALFKHFLVFFNVGDRSWAISQNVLLGGRDREGRDLTNEMTFAILDAYYDMNLPQPILSVKLHRGTPDALYAGLGRFFFTPGCLTPSLFNDESVFAILEENGFDPADWEDYAVAGCQEPLIMGRDNGNTTNSWLNLPKILELTLNGGRSTLTGRKIGPPVEIDDPLALLKQVRERFYERVDWFADRMAEAANNASRAVACLPVPFLSAFMGGLETGYDMRDTRHQGTKYNASGCLIHGLSVIADSFVAIDCLLAQRPAEAGHLLGALRDNFRHDEELRQFLLSCPKFGNNDPAADGEARAVADRISDLVHSKKNYLGNSFRADWSTPSTHLLYGYWVGATPDGRPAREMLNYGVDPFYGDAQSGLGFRTLSMQKLPFHKMDGGYASHFGINPHYFRGATDEEKGLEFRSRVIRPLFFNERQEGLSPFYLYVNVTTPDLLRKVLAEPKKYAPSGVYIMRIHGTFVNFLDLSPAIQSDIIRRLDPCSTSL
ncbi:MAG TPA: pyruvate formate lyase family protein [Firmicutes bacterium]|nr:pyruvate formate lyase family protein [Bacillota bacterium]